MKNKVLIICTALILFIFLVYGTYAWYLYFLRMSGEYVANNNWTNLQSGSLVLEDDGYGVYDADAKSLNDDNLGSVPVYSFRVINTKNTQEKYNLYIEDLPLNAINDGCTMDTLLERDDLKYQLTLNGNLIKEGFMKTINDNILDTREISGKETNNYTLKIYIHDEALDWYGKHYHYQVKINR